MSVCVLDGIPIEAADVVREVVEDTEIVLHTDHIPGMSRSTTRASTPTQEQKNNT